MEIPTRADIDELIAARDAPCVSLFMPAHRKGAETQQDRPRLKNLLDGAESRLLELGLRGPEARKLLEPGRERLDDGVFWRYQGDGLAAYLAPGWARVFRVPFALPELLVVSGRCHVRPLFEGLWPDQSFHLLALSLSEVRFFEGSRFALERRRLPGAPQGIEETQRFLVAEKQLHAKVGPRRDVPRAAIYHGHGAEREAANERIAEYLREVDRALLAATGRSGPPLVLAGVDHVVASYRAVTGYGRVADGAVEGNPDELIDEQLHAAAWPLVEPIARRDREVAVGRCAEAAAKGDAVVELGDALRAAVQGRLESLFVVGGEHRWGWFDAETGEARAHRAPEPGDEDLVDRALVETWRTGGSLHTLSAEEMPVPGPVAGLTRY